MIFISTEFEIPEFIKNEDTETILARMFGILPETMSKEENGWISDLFLPVAIEHARAIEFVLVEAIKNIVPKYSYGSTLLRHAETRKIERRKASYAKAVLKIMGVKDTVIPKGFEFSTVSSAEEEGVIFASDEEYTIPENGEIYINVTCMTSGTIGNVAAETIILMLKPIEGIKSVVNESPAYDGFDEETEDSLRQRIIEYDLTQGVSFIGSASDYRRWALEVEGVGGAKVLSAKDDTGTVTIIISDTDGQPVSEELCGDVYNHIMSPDSPYERLAPVNALIDVISVLAMNIDISAEVVLEEEYTIDMVKPVFIENLKNSFSDDTELTEVKYAEIGAVLINTEGVSDYKNLLVNNGVSNIPVKIEYVPVISEDRVTLI